MSASPIRHADLRHQKTPDIHLMVHEDDLFHGMTTTQKQALPHPAGGSSEGMSIDDLPGANPRPTDIWAPALLLTQHPWSFVAKETSRPAATQARPQPDVTR
jgi:hypothetical protein